MAIAAIPSVRGSHEVGIFQTAAHARFVGQNFNPAPDISEEVLRLHESASAGHAGADRESTGESAEDIERRRAAIDRAMFMRETAPMYTRYIGAVLAAVGCILYPVQLLMRQAEAEAAQEEEDGATVVE